MIVPPVKIQVRMVPISRREAFAGGNGRQDFAEKRNLKNRYQEGANALTPEQNRRSHIVGAFGEKTSADYLLLPWDAKIGQTGGHDIGDGIQVRTRDVERGQNEDLFIGPHDERHKNYPYILCHLIDTGVGIVDICGWIMCRDGLTEQFQQTTVRYGRGAHFIRPNQLRDMREFPLPFLVD